MLRLGRDGVLLLTVDRVAAERYWLTRDYLPDGNAIFAPLANITDLLPTPPQIVPLPIPHDCLDGFVQAFWKQPHALLDPYLQSTMALFARLRPSAAQAGLDRLRAGRSTSGPAGTRPAGRGAQQPHRRSSSVGEQRIDQAGRNSATLIGLLPRAQPRPGWSAPP
jgi:hypothetical protein